MPIELGDPGVVERILTSPEYDSSLGMSSILSFMMNFVKETLETDRIDITFRASDIPDDPASDSQWVQYSEVTQSGVEIPYSSLNKPEIKGKYKQARLRLVYII